MRGYCVEQHRSSTDKSPFPVSYVRSDLKGPIWTSWHSFPDTLFQILYWEASFQFPFSLLQSGCQAREVVGFIFYMFFAFE